MKVIIAPGKSRNIIATVAIGDSYFQAWEQHALPTWRRYCERNDLGLVVVDADLISLADRKWKKATWQKLLIGHEMRSVLPTVRNVCFLDSDILINYMAPNVFDYYDDPETIGLVSERKNLPYSSLDEVLRRVAFFRHRYYDEKYPLDSALFMSLEQIYEYHQIDVQDDYACSGFFVFNVANHSDLLRGWFNNYDRDVESLTGGGEEPLFNYEVQSWGNVAWLDYRFHTLWLYEMAWKYPFLYAWGRDNQDVIRECVEASLFTNYFLHFAGSWHESDMWKVGGVLEGWRERERLESFVEYLEAPVTGQPVGQIMPES